ncbi:MAG TPA: hypothetical protein VEK15_26200 [Vicinamibacteria bacterium]|nr:hypothetical protein [Vicinamibacteria bacterium]
MNKTEVYSWRLCPELKARLEEAARDEETSVAQLLEKIAREWLALSRREDDDVEEQQRLHREAARHVGSIHGGDPRRAQEASDRVRDKLKKKHVSKRTG